jgi:hypothetical protein
MNEHPDLECVCSGPDRCIANPILGATNPIPEVGVFEAIHSVIASMYCQRSILDSFCSHFIAHTHILGNSHIWKRLFECAHTNGHCAELREHASNHRPSIACEDIIGTRVTEHAHKGAPQDGLNIVLAYFRLRISILPQTLSKPSKSYSRPCPTQPDREPRTQGQHSLHHSSITANMCEYALILYTCAHTSRQGIYWCSDSRIQRCFGLCPEAQSNTIEVRYKAACDECLM